MVQLLLYDADCAFCTRSALLGRRLGLSAQIVPMQDVDLAPLGIAVADAEHAVPFVAQDGSVSFGHRAIAAALRTGPFGWRLLGRVLVLPGISPVAALVYRWVAANRYRLPGGTAACSIRDARRAS
jgi:predicted DCC family thiol-disulfide oxidoreductase YuxK